MMHCIHTFVAQNSFYKKRIYNIYLYLYLYNIQVFLYAFLDVLEMGKISVKKKHTHSRVETDPWVGFNESSFTKQRAAGLSVAVAAGCLTVNMKPFTHGFAYFPQLQSCKSRVIASFCAKTTDLKGAVVEPGTQFNRVGVFILPLTNNNNDK